MIQKLRGQKGFTLIELMIVIAIIGILAAIAIPNFIAYRDKTYCSAAETDAQNILAAISCYFSNPLNTSITYANLQLDPTCKVTLSNAGAVQNTGNVTENADGSITVTVKDGTGRCPSSNDGNLLYTTYMGTNTAPGWK